MTDRIGALRAALAEADLDGLFSLSPPANQYFSGFTGTTSAVLVSAREAVFLCDFRYTEQAARQVRGFETHEVQGAFETRCGEWLDRLGIRRAGFDPHALTVAQRDAVAKAAKASLESTDIVQRLRQVKDAEEIAALREASTLGEGVLFDLVERLRPGMREREAAAFVEHAFKERGAQGPSFDTIALFGPRSSLPHGMPGDKPLERGDAVLFDFGCRLGGYCSDLTRTFAFGTIPGAWFEEIYDLTLTAQRIALEAIRPGIPCREVDAIARDLIRDAGYGAHFGHGLGHGVGLEIHESPRLNMHSEAVLEAGMVVTVEPGVYLPGKGGVRIEDLVVVTEDGCDILTNAPKALRVLGE